MKPITNGSAGLIAAIATPRENFAARQAARQEALQLQNILSTQQQQEVADEQAAAAALEQQLAAERALPFFGKDRQNLASHVKGEEKQVFERLRDNYAGDARRWFAAEGQSWMAGAAARLQKAPFYQNATQNRAAVLAAQQAITEGKHIVGTAAADGYRSGEQHLQDFLEGKSDSFSFKGSYKPDDDLKEFRDRFAPGRLEHERVAVSEEEKLAHLINKYGQEGGQDRYYRQYRMVPTYYKSSSLNAAIKFGQDNARFGMEQGRFGMEQGRFRMQQEDQSRQRELFGLQKQGLKLSNAKKAQELSGDGANGLPFDTDFFLYPTAKLDLRHEAGVKKQLPYSGTDISRVRTLAGRTLFGDAVQPIAQQLGLQRTKDGTYTSGNIREAFSPDNGTGVFDLSKSQFTVQSIEPTLFYDPVDVTPAGLSPAGVNGYVRVKVQFNSDASATAAGLYNERWGWLPDGSTKAGTGNYVPNNDDNPANSRTATLMVPIGKVDAQHNKPLMKAIQKETMGVSAANKAQVDAPYLPSPMR